MPVTGTGTSYNLEYLVGALFKVATNEAPLLGMIGGMTGGRSVKTKQIPWQSIDNAAPSQPAVLEGADPTAAERTRTQYYNVCQIHQEAVKLTFTQQAAINQIQAASVSVLGEQPVASEGGLQTELKLQKIASDIDYSFFNGVFVDDTNIATARQTRGLFAAATNSVDALDGAPAGTTLTTVTATAATDVLAKTAHGLQNGDEIEITAIGGGAAGLVVATAYWVINRSADDFKVSATYGGAAVDITSDSSGAHLTIKKRQPLTRARFNKLLRTMYTAGAPFRMPVVFVSAFQKQRFSDVYGFAEQSQERGGVAVDVIDTDQGEFGIKLVRNIPVDRVLVADLSVCKPAFLDIPASPQTGRPGGHLLMHPLAQTGSADTWEIYCEVGLEYGPPNWHGYLDGLTTDEALV